jgi:hypothetical protein
MCAGANEGPVGAGEIRDKEVSVMSGKMDAENAKAPTPLDIFEGIKGRLPETDRELEEWLRLCRGQSRYDV